MEDQLNDATQIEDKTVAILSYMTLIGWVIALVMHGSNKTKLGAYHLRQTLGLFVIAMGFMVINIGLAFIPFIGALLSMGIGVTLLVLWILGLVAAANGEMKPMPIIGEPIQNILKDFAK